jgi:hypothetical protein
MRCFLFVQLKAAELPARADTRAVPWHRKSQLHAAVRRAQNDRAQLSEGVKCTTNRRSIGGRRSRHPVTPKVAPRVDEA